MSKLQTTMLRFLLVVQFWSAPRTHCIYSVVRRADLRFDANSAKDFNSVSADPEEPKKDVAIFYPNDLKGFVDEVKGSLKELDVSIYPMFEDDGIEKPLKDALDGSKFRVFLLKDEVLSDPTILQDCRERDTLIISAIESPQFRNVTVEIFTQEWIVKEVADIIRKFKSSDADNSNSTDTSSRSDLDPTTESAVSTLNESALSSPVPLDIRRRRSLETEISPQPLSSENKPEGEIKKDRSADPTLGDTRVVDEPQRPSSLPFVMILVVALFGIGFGWGFGILEYGLGFKMEINQISVEERVLNASEKFQNRIKALQTEFDQDPKFWKIVRSTMKKHIVDEKPRQPTVLMLVSTKPAAEVREELAREVAMAYSARCNREPVWVSGDDYVAQDHAEAKEKMDEKISAGFSNSSCATVVSNFERLPPATTTVFYQFCENDQAPFKKVAVIFTLEISHGSWDSDAPFKFPEDGEVPETKLWDQIVENYLYHSLQTRDHTGNMKRDMIGGLLSRITPAVAWVKK